MPAVLARIFLQCFATFLVTKGWLAPDMGNMLKTDPDVFILVQFGLAAAASGAGWVWYYAAKKFGWRT